MPHLLLLEELLLSHAWLYWNSAVFHPYPINTISFMLHILLLISLVIGYLKQLVQTCRRWIILTWSQISGSVRYTWISFVLHMLWLLNLVLSYLRHVVHTYLWKRKFKKMNQSQMKQNKSFKKMIQSPMKPKMSFSLKDCKCIGPIGSLTLKKPIHTSMATDASSFFSSSCYLGIILGRKNFENFIFWIYCLMLHSYNIQLQSKLKMFNVHLHSNLKMLKYPAELQAMFDKQSFFPKMVLTTSPNLER